MSLLLHSLLSKVLYRQQIRIFDTNRRLLFAVLRVEFDDLLRELEPFVVVLHVEMAVVIRRRWPLHGEILAFLVHLPMLQIWRERLEEFVYFLCRETVSFQPKLAALGFEFFRYFPPEK